MRLTGKDPLRLRFAKDLDSYGSSAIPGASGSEPEPPVVILTEITIHADLSKTDSSVSFLAFIQVRKKFWLLPIVMMLLFGGLLVLAQGSAIAPFIYTLF